MIEGLDPRQIARTMGGDVTGRDSANVPGPGHGKADRSLAIKINSAAPGGFVVFSHAGDDPIECRDYVRDALRLGSWKDDARNPTPLSVTIAGSDADMDRRKEFALKIWRQSSPATGTVVEKYLREQRALTLSPDICGSVVRYHPRLKYGPDQALEAMVCLMRNIMTDEPTAIHRTFLDRDGKKVDRRMLGIAKGAAIKIDRAPDSDGRLTIGEGFESSLGGRLAKLGPAWALASSVGVKSFPVVDAVSRLTILGENDPTSRLAVRTVKDRYLESRRPVDVVTPRRGLSDFNDVWREAQK